MVRVFLTGGSGLLGNNILRAGIERGWQFTTLIRGSTDLEPFEGLDVQLASGDLNTASDIEACVAKCDAVIHSAAHIHIGWKHLEEALRINRDGTKTIVDAARKHNKPLVHISTVNALAIGQKDQPADENTPGDGQIPSTYVVSKRAADQVVLDAMKSHDGAQLRATLVHPGFMLGPNDWKPSSGRMIVELSKGCPPMSPSGGCSVCDARDVASAVLEVIAQNRFGDRYILAGRNMTYFELWSAIADKLKQRKPFTILRRPGQVVVGKFSDRFLCRAGKEADTNSAAVKMGSQFHYYSSAHAMRDLNYISRPFETTLDNAVQWLIENGKLTLKR